MSQAQTSIASKAQGSKAQPKAKARKPLSQDKAKAQPAQPFTPEAIKTASTGLMRAVLAVETAGASFAEKVAAIAKTLKAGRNMGLTAEQYEQTVGKALARSFKAHVEAGKLAASSAASRRSEIKTAVLAVVNGLSEPKPKESMRPFCERVRPLLEAATTASGQPVLVSKTGRKPGTGKGAKLGPKGGALPGAVQAANAAGGAKLGAANARTDGAPRDPMLAAAMILCPSKPQRAAKLVKVLAMYGEQFDKWSETVLADDATL